LMMGLRKAKKTKRHSFLKSGGDFGVAT